MKITLTSNWTSEQLAWHYNEMFWNAEILSENEMNDIIWFEWEDIMRIYNCEEK